METVTAYCKALFRICFGRLSKTKKIISQYSR